VNQFYTSHLSVGWPLSGFFTSKILSKVLFRSSQSWSFYLRLLKIWLIYLDLFSEAWALTYEDASKVQAADMKFLTTTKKLY
jgi:hypothetical protein